MLTEQIPEFQQSTEANVYHLEKHITERCRIERSRKIWKKVN